MMNTNNRQELIRYHRERMTKLMANTRVANDTSFHVLDEAATHLIEHFDPPRNMDCRHDHCLIVGSSYFGEAVDDPAKSIKAECMFMFGDAHALSHTLAEAMHQDKDFAKMIFHAMEVYALHDREKTNTF